MALHAKVPNFVPLHWSSCNSTMNQWLSIQAGVTTKFSCPPGVPHLAPQETPWIHDHAFTRSASSWSSWSFLCWTQEDLGPVYERVSKPSIDWAFCQMEQCTRRRLFMSFSGVATTAVTLVGKVFWEGGRC